MSKKVEQTVPSYIETETITFDEVILRLIDHE